MESNTKKVMLQVANIIGPILIFIILSLLSLGQGDFREIFEPAGNESLIDPINFAFAIWGPIFLFLIIYLIYQARDIFKKPEDKIKMPYVFQIGPFFILSTLMASLWYLIWLYRIIWLATLCMVVYLIFLVAAYLRLDINLKQRTTLEKITVYVSWSMYTAWVTAATIVSITTLMVSSGFNNPPLIPDAIWGIIVLLVALFIYTLVLIMRNDVVFAGVGIWVLFGILMERLLAPILVIEIIITCIIGIIILSVAIIYQIVRK
ncbi:MAG: hypothetical protein GF317_09605 [Candidatus Lokiarchaeota archaeon]|nr:hypothetical protein [Candidatus Lokiarchaeota archaeon]MBD3199965.1 hypothetical protein [Candidatus Lokiarchaeota archaeon]